MNRMQANPISPPTHSEAIVALIDQVKAKGVALQTRSALIALHFLLPTLFLPALDLLDQSLVGKFSVELENSISSYFVYYVRSTQSNNGLSSRVAYEVRPDVWSCTCPGFVVSAYSLDYESCRNENWGGQIIGSPPLCKHLLACILAERSGEAFKEKVKHSTVTMEELAEYGIS
ncbi:hypothetical protein NEOLI_001332 [Neolecta irregularis DAH-3]|uniref:SWIM-type domain-containing protein n=1 Tax=Neolecta irregularis (strain DAH-3) TaxID=1198029 RepID=A0A1U7LVT0_NEOID|nr:hypothetical protein NEOLI_001332 [Neolecta irregularis DAH-3]|eukprot:OLL26728.1 hypothetical protein NEOLI_001332 [Neolecta irregularis DAH-3]